MNYTAKDFHLIILDSKEPAIELIKFQTSYFLDQSFSRALLDQSFSRTLLVTASKQEIINERTLFLFQ